MLKEIKERKSIRKFQDKEVELEKIKSLLHSAMQAPTCRNMQSWRFIVVCNRQALCDMETLQPYMGMMKNASCAIIVLGDSTINPKEGYLYVDAAASIENILLEAVHLDLGTCWCAIAPDKDRIDNFRNYYHIDKNLLPIAAIAIGYPDEQKEFIDRYDPNKITWYE